MLQPPPSGACGLQVGVCCTRCTARFVGGRYGDSRSDGFDGSSDCMVSVCMGHSYTSPLFIFLDTFLSFPSAFIGPSPPPAGHWWFYYSPWYPRLWSFQKYQHKKVIGPKLKSKPKFFLTATCILAESAWFGRLSFTQALNIECLVHCIFLYKAMHR